MQSHRYPNYITQGINPYLYILDRNWNVAFGYLHVTSLSVATPALGVTS